MHDGDFTDYVRPVVNKVGHHSNLVLKSLREGIFHGLFVSMNKLSKGLYSSGKRVEEGLGVVVKRIRGKGIIKSDRKASAFLKDIREHKETIIENNK